MIDLSSYNDLECHTNQYNLDLKYHTRHDRCYHFAQFEFWILWTLFYKCETDSINLASKPSYVLCILYLIIKPQPSSSISTALLH